MRIPKRAGVDIQPTHAFAKEEGPNNYRVSYLPAGIPIDYRVTMGMLARMVTQGVAVYVTTTRYPVGTFRGETRKGALVWIECPPVSPTRHPHDVA